MTMDLPRGAPVPPAASPTLRWTNAPAASPVLTAERPSEHWRRLRPRIIDTDWLVLRGLHAAVAQLAGQVCARGKVAIDFGCGSRPYQPIFAAAGVRYLGADLDDAADIRIGPAGHMGAADACADLVLSFQVLEHVRDLATYFGEARRVLRDDGWLLLSTHGNWLYHPHPEDHRRWTREGLLGEIAAHGFKPEVCVPVVGPLAWTTVLRLTCACWALRRVPLIGGPAASILAAVMNVRARLEDALTPAWVTADNACVYVTLSRPRRA